jgi:hypothetical protein
MFVFEIANHLAMLGLFHIVTLKIVVMHMFQSVDFTITFTSGSPSYQVTSSLKVCSYRGIYFS